MCWNSLRSMACGLTAVLVLSVGSLRAEDEEPKKDTPPAAKEKNGDSPQALFLKIRTLQRTLGQDDITDDEYANTVTAILKTAEAFASHEDAGEQEQTAAKRLTILTLASAARKLPAKFAKPFDEAVEAAIKADPASDAAAFATAFRLISKHHLQSESGLPGKDFVDDLTKFKESFPKNPIVGQLAMLGGEKLAGEERYKEAIALYRKGAELEPRMEEDLAAAAEKLELIGKPLPIAGPTLAGEKFDIAAMKGKVVLVDFWATWCGPCIAELPNVKSVYEKHHANGFEIVGVSLDNEEADLKEFVEKNEMPWAQIIFGKEEERGWNNPLARKLKVNGIPAMFIVGRDGNVTAMDVRGPGLEKAIEKALKAKAPTPLAN